ncbi:MAG: hypothetical protein A3C11_00105 [Candidatus Sungbacteria bacterium RIFCSPHIGHO2_02_FULL_49_12]|uniref:Uncharacterized protein n=1 Tax=Candidatus Sungbacteria bacterium RIFCSPHIGHO2_02_FULL_49_12 TaxID=1802271 RepID=A0A1G2KQP2_9BACT|nr:MAG: hypothetical protein A3C11_00105 [Candidatus Sungbacteria bacterium RIFCSPHIGHO2_02_FULL_49_12]
MLDLNVLPPAEKRNFKYERARRVLVRFGVRFFFVAVVFTILLLPSYFLTVFQEQSVLSASANLSKDPRILHVADIERQIDSSNKAIKKLKGYLTRSLSIASVAEELAATTTAGVKINSITIDTLTKKVGIYGFAPRRQDLLLTIAHYRALSFVSSVDSPITNLVHDTNIKFNLSIFLK